MIRYCWPLPFDTLGHRKGDWVSSIVKGFFELCWASYRKAGYQK